MAPPPAREPSGRAAAREAVFAWFDANGPAYPWRRREGDPYAVLVSEVMLQQTQASRVVESFPTFLRRFPDVVALATASRASVLRAWGALGYHRRAVALHETSRTIVREHGGRVPADVATLLELPGIGPYTAAAVASIAYGVPVAAIDTNARKVLARVAAGRDPDDVSATAIVDAAERWLARDRPGDWNQALMNLGRTICRPRPRCDVCPFASVCSYRTSGGRGGGGLRPRSQPAFEGSMRQLRGAVVRELRRRQRAATIAALALAVGEPEGRIEGAVEALARDGIAERTGAGRIRLPR